MSHPRSNPHLSPLLRSRNRAISDLLSLARRDQPRHLVEFYESDSQLLANVALIAARVLASNDAVVLVMTAEHLAAVNQLLAAGRVDPARLEQSRRLITIDADQVLSSFADGSGIDARKFGDTFDAILAEASRTSGSGFVFTFGEVVDRLCAAGRSQVALELEQLWNQATRRYRLSLYCAYSFKHVAATADAQTLVRICAEHSLTLPPELVL
ncbi:MAG TPA: MEDS domain-containing protein [Candidatus Binataceae bacterium]|nr:MEDS domain-containing protein [Candidatus Binataceae bacterium]